MKLEPMPGNVDGRAHGRGYRCTSTGGNEGDVGMGQHSTVSNLDVRGLMVSIRWSMWERQARQRRGAEFEAMRLMCLLDLQGATGVVGMEF